MIQFVDVKKQYGKFQALKGVTFTASEKDITGIIGHNGAGKTSLFMIANGLSKPSGGDVLIDDVSLQAQRARIQAMTGLYTDNLYLYPMLTVRECLRFFIGVFKSPKTKYNELIQTFRLQEHEKKLVSALSTGLMKRLKLAVSVVNSPKVLFLDEPFSGLDPESRIDIMNLLKDIKNNDIQLLISSHDLLELETIVNRIVLLKNGAVAADDYLDTLMSAHFPEHILIIQVQSSNIEALLDYLDRQQLSARAHPCEKKGSDIYQLRLGIREYYQLENQTLPNSKIISVSSLKPTLDDLYFKLNKSVDVSRV
jgi:ABC-2 type transport system ATP-binding protein